MPRVSVILISYNAGRYLAGAIDSVLSQTYQDFELVIVDDNSSDPLVKPALDAVQGFSNVRVIRCLTTEQERRESVRYAFLINEVVGNHSSGELLSFLCSDDYWMPDRLERMVRLVDAGANVVYGAQHLVQVDERGEEHEFGVRAAFGPLEDAYHRVDLNSVMVTRKAFEDAGGFPTEPTSQNWREADARFWRRLSARGYVFEPVPGGPSDVKRYREDGVDARVIAGLEPWSAAA